MAHHGAGIRSQLDQKSPVWMRTESDRNAMPELKAGGLTPIPVGRDAFEKADEEENGIKKPAVKFDLTDSLPQHIKGKQSPNLSSPIHNVCTIAILTKEGSNAARDWSNKAEESCEAIVKKKKNIKRKARRVHARKKRGDTDKAMPTEEGSPCPTPEALGSIKLR